MFETIAPNPGGTQRAARIAAAEPRAGAERQPRDADLGPWLASMLDEIDYGMLLVGSDGQVLFMNHAARLELDGSHPLQRMGRGLRAGRPQDVAPLHDALDAAQRGRRKLVTLGEAEHRVAVSVVPLGPLASFAPPAGEVQADDAQPNITLLVLGKRQVCEQLSVQGFARAMSLTPAETRVLELLCGGVKPTEIAGKQGVAVSTVRTQIGSIRAKTGAASIRELVRQVAVLPPLVGTLRAGAAALVPPALLAA